MLWCLVTRSFGTDLLFFLFLLFFLLFFLFLFLLFFLLFLLFLFFLLFLGIDRWSASTCDWTDGSWCVSVVVCPLLIGSPETGAPAWSEPAGCLWNCRMMKSQVLKSVFVNEVITSWDVPDTEERTPNKDTFWSVSVLNARRWNNNQIFL